MPHVSFGIATAPQQVDDDEIVRVWREADAIPEIEHAWLFDHLMPITSNPLGPIFEGWTLLSAVIQRQLRHASLAITLVVRRGIDNTEIVPPFANDAHLKAG